MELSDVFGSLRRHWRLVVLIVVLTGAVLVGYLVNRKVVNPPARYHASADVLIPARDAKTGDRPADIPPVLLQGQVELASSSTTRDAATKAAKLDATTARKVAFTASLNDRGDIITLNATGPTPDITTKVITEYVNAYINARRQSVVDDAKSTQAGESRTISQLLNRVHALTTLLQASNVDPPVVVPDGETLALPPSTPENLQLAAYERNTLANEIQSRRTDYANAAKEAFVPDAHATLVQRRAPIRVTPAPPSPLIPMLAILGVGLLIAVAAPTLLDRFDRSITDSQGASSALKAPVLTVIPNASRWEQTRLAATGSANEAAFRSLAATSVSTDRLPRAMMVTSPVGTMHNYVAANFAAALAGMGLEVALVGTTPQQNWYSPNGSGRPFDAHDAAAALSRNGGRHTNGGRHKNGDGHTDGDVPTNGDATPDAEPEPEPEPSVEPTASEPTEPSVPEWPWTRRFQTTEPTEPAAPTDPTAPIRATGAEPGEGEGEGAASSERVATQTQAPPARKPTFPELLEAAQAGILEGRIRDQLSRGPVEHLYVLPPGDDEIDLPLDGLPPLLEALERDGIDVTVIAGPPLLDDPNATIIAWATRSVLWAIESGKVARSDAQEAAARLDLAGVAPFGVALIRRS